mgnify:CR=1 FL=1
MNATLQKKKLQSELDKAILNVKEGNVKNFDTLEDMMTIWKLRHEYKMPG